MATMRKVSFIIALVLVSTTAWCVNATIEWTLLNHDFGKIVQNKEVTYEFKFKNPGMMPLIISEVKSSCGCTVPHYPKEPIRPGSTGAIKVVYDSKDEGFFSKTISVYTNTSEGVTKLYIKGEVVKETTSPPTTNNTTKD